MRKVAVAILLGYTLATSLFGVGAVALSETTDPKGALDEKPQGVPCPGIIALSPETQSLRPPPHIDCPGITASTFLGGSDSDWAVDVAIDPTGSVYVTGYTYSRDFPTTPGAFDPYGGIPANASWADAFVAKFNPLGSLEFSTFLAGSSADFGFSIAVDSDGNAYITGVTVSPDFPVTSGALQRDFRGQDAFVAKFDPQGQLVFSTFLGGSGDEVGESIDVD